jgi:hypothetical protein
MGSLVMTGVVSALGYPLTAVLSVAAGLVVSGGLASWGLARTLAAMIGVAAFVLCGALGCAGLWWLGRWIRTRAIDRLLAWPGTLPFPLAGWPRWLVDWEDIHAEYLWITFAEPAPRQLVNDALAAEMPDTAPHWLDACQVGLELRGVSGFESAYGSGWVPDVAAIKRLVHRVLVPLHGSLPIQQLVLTRQGPDARGIEQRRDFAAHRLL